MSKIKRVVLAILVVLASTIIGCGIAVGATEDKLLGTSNLSVGGTYSKSGSILCDYKNVLCIDHTSELSFRRNYNFEVRNIIKIEGNTSTGKKDSKDKEYTSESNGVLAYLLSEYKTKIGYTNAHKDNEVQLDVWRYINTWKSEIGKKYDGLSDMSMSGGSTYTGKTSEKIKEAKKYASEIESKEKIKDNTDKGSVNTSIFIDEEGKEYLRIGPFNWAFSGKIDELHVESEMMKEDTNARILTYKDKEVQFGKNSIQSGKNFYVLLKVKSFEGLSGKVTISATQKIEEKTATIYFLQNKSGEQNLMIYKNKSTNKDINVSYKYEPQFTTIKIEKYADGTSETIKGATFGLYRKGEDGELHEISKEKTNENGVIKFTEIPIDNYVLKELEPAEGYKINGSAEVTIGTKTTTYTDLENIKVKLKTAIEENKNYRNDPKTTVKIIIYNKTEEKEDGNIKIIKRDSSTKQVLAGAEFIVQNAETGKYIITEYDKEQEVYIYKEEGEEASTFTTDESGEIYINNVPLGEYKIIETKTPDPTTYPTTVTQDVTVKKGNATQNEFTIYNDKTSPPPEGIDISGYVWEDLADGKNNLYNNLYYEKGEDYGDGQISQDLKVSEVTVQLIDSSTGDLVTDKNGNPCTTQTGEEGRYKFEGVNKNNLSNYYVIFIYDGLKYQAIAYDNKENLSLPNSSKAKEDENNRTEFNNQFAEITGTENLDENKGYAISASGNKSELEYDTTAEEHKAKFINNGKYTISASTLNNGYNLSEYYVEGSTELKDINLGVYRRQEADIAIVSDIDNVKLSINGYEHTYEYKKREEYIYEDDEEFKEIEKDGFNVGVKFADEAYNTTYERAVYKTDYEYNAEKASNNLAVSVTYLITLKNQTGELVQTVNELANYASTTYGKVVSSKVKYTTDGKTVENNIEWKETSKYGNTYSDENYTGHYVDLSNIEIQPNKLVRVYVTFDLSKEDISKILTDNTVENDNQLLNNISEINSYSTYKDNNIYAAIDKDSAPGNIVNTSNLLNNKSTGEDDTDLAPGLKLVVANARSLKGTVFEDKSELSADNTRNGNGIYEAGETGISGIKVIMKGKENGTGKEIEYETVTNDEGNFEVEGFIPGDYTVEYIWGENYNNKYNVVDYKGTIYINKDRQNTTDWHKKDVDIRYSDAIDNYTKRLEIDSKTSQVTAKTDIDTIKKEQEMNSTTPQFKVNVEYGDNELQTASTGDRFTYVIENVDFGIVERPMQKIDITKRISNVTVITTKGSVLVNATANRTLNADGTETITLEGETSGTKYLPVSPATPNGTIDIEIPSNDVEQGHIVTISYEIIATNNSEKDYLSENYYNYGNIEGELIKITPTTLIDYVDNNIAFDKDVNTAWTPINKDELKDLVKDGLVTASDGTDGALAKYNTIIKTDSLNTALRPGENKNTSLVVSKMLTVNEGLDCDNNTELVVYGKDGGRTTQATPGNYNPIDLTTKEADSDISESVIITSPTGGVDYIYQYIIVGFACLAILGVGIVIIKRIVL